MARARKLPVPVVSVGNITTGGTGKTPVTIELLRDFQNRNPGLLTRGHGRSTGEIVLLPSGCETLPIGLTGDEAQLYVRGVGVPIAVGAERYDAAVRLLEEVPVDLFFLDDGFQHVQLQRDFNLVLIDALNPFGGGHLLPLGRLREPLKGLARADAFLITRATEAAAIRGIESVLQRYNPQAPVFFSRTKGRCWSNDAGEVIDLQAMNSQKSIAFCGLGNPNAFWRTLDTLGVRPLECFQYGDHHRYKPTEIRRLSRHALDLGVDTLLTTAKDAVNLCPGVQTMLGGLKLYWLEIGVEIDRREELLSLISSRLK